MILQAINNTAGTLTYSAESVTLTAGQTVTVPTNVVTSFSVDPAVISDIKNGNLSLSDSVTTYNASVALDFLNSISQYTNKVSTMVSGTGAALNATPIASTDVTGYKEILLNITGTYNATYSLEGSFNNSTWFPVWGLVGLSDSVNDSILQNNESLNGLWKIPVITPYFRVRISAYVSGTVSASAMLALMPVSDTQQIDTVVGLVGQLATSSGIATASAHGPIVQGVVKSTAPSYSDAQSNFLSLTTAGALRTDASATTQPVSAPTLTKGTQAANGFSIQNLKDAGRNQTNYFMALQIVSTSSDALLSLTGYKSGAAVGATTTPAVVTSGKIYRINSITLTYVTIITTPGAIRFTLRANTGGVVAITSPAVAQWIIGEPTGIAPIAGKFNTVTIPFPDGMEFAAGTGIGISQVGIGIAGVAAAVGYGNVTINGYEY